MFLELQSQGPILGHYDDSNLGSSSLTYLLTLCYSKNTKSSTFFPGHLWWCPRLMYNQGRYIYQAVFKMGTWTFSKECFPRACEDLSRGTGQENQSEEHFKEVSFQIPNLYYKSLLLPPKMNLFESQPSILNVHSTFHLLFQHSPCPTLQKKGISLTYTESPCMALGNRREGFFFLII